MHRMASIEIGLFGRVAPGVGLRRRAPPTCAADVRRRRAPLMRVWSAQADHWPQAQRG